jgi:hypothetical protein
MITVTVILVCGRPRRTGAAPKHPPRGLAGPAGGFQKIGNFLFWLLFLCKSANLETVFGSVQISLYY